MGLTKLGIRNVRNLEFVDLTPSSHLNLIFGDNASGKTSFLEAIYMLGRGKSFRSWQIDRVIQAGHSSLSVFGTVENENGQEVPIGLERNHSELKARIAGQKVKAVSELAALLPIQIIQPNSHKLLEEGPKFRRNYLDWGVFHVEPSFYPAWLCYQRGLKQRNAALRARQHKNAAMAWDPQIIDAAEIIHDCRERYTEVLKQNLPRYIEPIMGSQSIEIHYYPGWNASKSYGEALKERQERDLEQGYTQSGPHRADLLFKIEGVNASERVSRGQQKILVAACLLAQVGAYSELSGKPCILLVDDLTAELDQNHWKGLLKIISGMNVQLFITAIEAEQLISELPKARLKMFHVEHGNIKEVVQ